MGIALKVKRYYPKTPSGHIPQVVDDAMTRAQDWFIVVLVFAAVSTIIFASGLVSLGFVEDMGVSPVITSLALLVPLFLWFKRYEKSQKTSIQEGSVASGKRVWTEVFGLFLLSMSVRIPFVLILGMSYEKTAVIYLLVLTAVLAIKTDVGALGFRTERFARSLLIGLVFYLALAIPMFTALFGFVYLFTGHLLVSGYNLLPAMFVFPYMTFCVGVSEEGLFRGFMQTRLARVYSERKALLVQAFLFGLWHFVWHVAPFNLVGMTIHVTTTFAFGLVFGQFFRESQNLVPLILAHGLVDTVEYGAIFNQELEITAYLIQGSQAFSYIIGIVALALSTKLLARKAMLAGINSRQIHT